MQDKKAIFSINVEHFDKIQYYFIIKNCKLGLKFILIKNCV